MLADNGILEGSSVELDDAYFGGKHRGRLGRGADTKAVAIAPVQRQSRVRTKGVKNPRKSAVATFAVETAKPNSVLYTDEFPGYKGASSLGYHHQQVEHNAKIFVRDDVHTNNIEGFCSLVERDVGGAYHKADKEYLETYLNELAFRCNRSV